MGNGSTAIGCIPASTGALPGRPTSSRGEDDPQRILERLIVSVDPQVVAFGDEECCGGEDGGPSSVMVWFANHFLPLMAEHGFRDIVVELLPEDPEVERELVLFVGGTEISEEATPRLFMLVNMHTDPGTQLLLESARRHGVRLHGGRGNWGNFLRSMMHTPEERERNVLAVRDTTLRQIRSLRAQGKKVMAFNGGLHNDPSPYARHASCSFGPELQREIGSRYLAVDIFYKRTIRDGPDFQPDSDWEPELGSRLRPHARSNPSQATCVRLRPDSYVFLLPSTAH